MFMRATLALGLMTTTSLAGGVDRSGQNIGVLFEKGNVVELSLGAVRPNVSGEDIHPVSGAALGRQTGKVAQNYTLPSVAFKYDIDQKLSFAFIMDQPFGADVIYPAYGGFYEGTNATLDSLALTGILRYKLSDAWSVHGGLRAQRAEGKVTLAGSAYANAGLDGYHADVAGAWGGGYVLGFAYEKPEIAMRAALTYSSAIEHDLDTTEFMGATQLGGAHVTTVKTPQSVNLDFQTGVAANTLVFGSVRWVDWSVFKISPQVFGGGVGRSLTDLEDSTTYTLGVGRKFNDTWSGSVFATYEPKGNDQVSPLAPTSGSYGVGVGAVYTRENMKLTMGARYMWLGDAEAAIGTPKTSFASMTDNKAVALGMKVSFSF